MAAVDTRVQLSDADRKVICELARDNKDLLLTALAATTLKKPGLNGPTVTGILSKRDKWLNISDSAVSSKKLKQRHNIKLQRPHAESGAADLEGADALIAQEFEQFPGEQQVEQDLTDDELVALVTDKPPAESVEDISDCELIEDVVSAP
ncbi:TPA: hypothetical protein ACH3X1_014094 [Trebouxia sp. C0004]